MNSYLQLGVTNLDEMGSIHNGSGHNFRTKTRCWQKSSNNSRHMYSILTTIEFHKNLIECEKIQWLQSRSFRVGTTSENKVLFVALNDDMIHPSAKNK